MLRAFVAGLDRDIEGMGFVDNAVAPQEVILGLEGKLIDVAAQPRQSDVECYGLGVERFIVLINIDVKFRLDALFEDRDLGCKIARSQHAAAMRSTLVVALSDLTVAALALSPRKRIVAAGKQEREGQSRRDRASGPLENGNCRHC